MNWKKKKNRMHYFAFFFLTANTVKIIPVIITNKQKLIPRDKSIAESTQFLAIIGLYNSEKPVSLTPTVPGSGNTETDKYKNDCKLVILR